MPIDANEQGWNASMIQDFRAHAGEITQGPLKGSKLLLLTSLGAKSGEPRTAVLGYTRDGDRYVVVGSNSGKQEHPAWIANVEASPVVTVEVGGETFKARATVTSDQERARLWDAHKLAIPAFANYETMTTRDLPVVTLARLTD